MTSNDSGDPFEDPRWLAYADRARRERPCPLGGDVKVCQDCNQLIAEKQELRDKLRGAYAVIAERQQRLEGDERNMRAARRQLELFMDDGIRERVTVALVLLDESVEGRTRRGGRRDCGGQPE